MNARKYDNFRLGAGDNCVFSTDSRATRLNNNIMVIGGTGSGKTKSVLDPIIANLQHSNCIAVATKRGDIDGLRGILKNRGYNVAVADFVNPEDSEIGIDPLQLCRNDGDVRNLANAIVYANRKELARDPYWDTSAENLIYIILKFVHRGYYEGGNRLIDAIKLLKNLTHSGGDDFKDYIEYEKNEKEKQEKEKQRIEEAQKEAEDESLTPIPQHIIDCLANGSEMSSKDEDILKMALEAREEQRERINRRKAEMEKMKARSLALANTSTNSNSSSNKKREALKKHPTYYALRNFAEVMPEDFQTLMSFCDLPPVTGNCVESSMRVYLDQTFTPEIMAILETAETYDFSEMLKPHTALFVHISPVNVAMHRYVAICYRLIFKELFELGEAQPSRELPYPVYIFADDFATGCKVPDFPQLISIFREKGVAATMLVQSISQLDTMYEADNANVIVDNCDTVVYLGGGSLRTCEYIAQRADRPVSEIINMPMGKEYIFRRGHQPILTDLYDFFSDPLFTAMIKYRNKEAVAEEERLSRARAI